MTSKTQRQHAILRLVSDSPITSQSEVREMLERRGIRATQATISRDFEELGIAKVREAGGRLRYLPPIEQAARPAPPDQLRRVLGEWVTDVTASGTLVVVRTPPGCAHVVASALDRSALPDLVGTVAGDDTVLCVAAEAIGGAALAATMRGLAGLATPEPTGASRRPRANASTKGPGRGR